MRILLCTAGTHGDVNPFLAIGRELRRRGHEVAVFVNPYFERDVRDVGLEFLAQADYVDIPSFIRENKIMDGREGSRRLFQTVLDEATTIIPTLCNYLDKEWRPDVVAAHPICVGFQWLCRERSIPYAMVVLTPAMWWSQHDPVPTIQKKPGGFRRRMCHLFQPLVRRAVRRAIARRFQAVQRRAGLESEPSEFWDDWYGGGLNLGMWSPHLRAEMPDDPPNAVICGFPWFDGAVTREPDPGLEGFLAGGEPPIVFSLGTSAVHVPGNFYEEAAEACRLLGRRGVLLCNTADAGPEDPSGNVRAFGYAPFSRVLPRGCASVIHGGVGSMAQALRAGRPTAVVPFAHDQFNHALRVEALGLGAMVPREKAGAKRLASTLRGLLEDPDVLARCRRMGERLEGEDGAGQAADRLERLGARPRP